jgi:hypothetical protein
MNATEYLQSSTLYRKLIYGPHGKLSQVYAARLSDEGFGRRCTWRSLSLFRDLMDWHVGNGHDPRAKPTLSSTLSTARSTGASTRGTGQLSGACFPHCEMKA